jgi:nucleotide-binding universal stress UspA family protein
MEDLAYQKYEAFSQQLPDMRRYAVFKPVCREPKKEIGELLVAEAKKAQADLLVISAKGMSAAALFILGSVTENVIRNNSDIPLLIYKKPN